MAASKKLLTIWIPTYQRPRPLRNLISSIITSGLLSIAEVVVSDNDPDDNPEMNTTIERELKTNKIHYIKNLSNLTAGINFLRAFEHAKTPWLMIVGDDDVFTQDSVGILANVIEGLTGDIAAVKFDSSLFGKQQELNVSRLQGYISRLKQNDYPDAFNNLCLISNWLFQKEPFLRHISSSFLGYSSKISHLFPLLQACNIEGFRIQFLAWQPVIHGSCEEATWPKAATWSEMVMTMSSFSGFVDKQDRKALLRLILHSDWRRYFAKCFRVQYFYKDPRHGISPWQIHLQLCLLSSWYGCAFLLSLPFLFLPFHWLPRIYQKQLGEPGRIDRW